MSKQGKPEQDPKTGRFIAGNSGGGRPKGARNKLGEAFCQDVYDKWQEKGPEVIERMIADKPGDFVKVVASMLPKQMDLNVVDHSEMSDEELHERIRNLAAQLGPFLGERTGNADEGTGGKAGAQKPSSVH